MESLLEKIQEVYELKLEFVEKVTEGFLTENYILAGGSTKYFLKKYRFKDASKIREIHEAKKYFLVGGILVVTPISTSAGESFFEYEGRFYTLFPFISDRQLKDGQITEKAIVSLAQTLARIHLLGRDAKISIDKSFTGWDKQIRLKEIEDILQKISKIEDKTGFDTSAEQNLLLKKRIIESNKQTYEQFSFRNDHLIHGDYMIGNVFFDADDNVSYIFDFEKTQYAPRFFELFRSMIYSTFLGDNVTQDALNLAKLYLNSYLAVYPMSKDELVSGFTAYCLRSAHSLWVEKEHYLLGNTRVDELLQSDILRTNYFSKHFEEMKEFLFK
ncbi:MAG: phosphotransferase [bacterium]|nr:phosphotransferase [bacterium]